MKKLARIFGEFLSPLGFHSSKSNFFLDGDGVVVVFNLQKSNYDRSYFLNIGLWIKSVGGENDSPKENFCHVRFRADNFIDSNYPGVSLGEFLHTDGGAADEKAELGLIDIASNYIYPLIEKIRSIDSVARMYRQGELAGAFVSKEAREVLSNR